MAEYFVTKHGNDDVNSGETQADAFLTVARGIERLGAGDTLSIGEGVYHEHVKIKGKPRVTIRSVSGERAVIDGSRAEFQSEPHTIWEPRANGEFVSRLSYPPRTDRGSFVDPDKHVRLITYSHLRDLRADNQTFGPLLEDERPPDGPEIETSDELLIRRPWVYMGPGLYQGKNGRLHVRLSHTDHVVQGVVNYEGPTDPRDLPLAVWTAPDPTFRIVCCPTLRMERITLRYGGGRTLVVKDSDDVTFDHLTVLAGPYGLAVAAGCHGTTVVDCEFDGGLPPWYFRSDRKDGYTIARPRRYNGLGEQTIKTLAYSVVETENTTFERCEFVNAHDLLLNGDHVSFRSNWVDNVNDDGVYLGKGATDVRIVGNVFQRCLHVLSLAARSSSGPVHVFRNLIDLRRPTAGRRPQPNPLHLSADERPVMRFGTVFKSNYEDPELNVVHNTVLIVQRERSIHNLFRAYDATSLRRSFNNIFVGIDNTGAPDRPLAFLPRVTDNAETDGNCYFGVRRVPSILLQVRPEAGAAAGAYRSLELMKMSGDGYFTQSQAAHPPGFEASVNDMNPRLRRYWGPLEVTIEEDLRLAEDSPAHLAGVILTDPVLREVDGNPSETDNPDIGCYPYDAPPMEVGVEGRRVFPSNPVAPPPPDA